MAKEIGLKLEGGKRPWKVYTFIHSCLGSLLLKLEWQALLSLFGNTTTTTTTTKAGNPFSTHS